MLAICISLLNKIAVGIKWKTRELNALELNYYLMLRTSSINTSLKYWHWYFPIRNPCLLVSRRYRSSEWLAAVFLWADWEMLFPYTYWKFRTWFHIVYRVSMAEKAKTCENNKWYFQWNKSITCTFPRLPFLFMLTFYNQGSHDG